MNYTERALCFPCAGDTLVGILAEPQTPASTGVVMIVGGPQYRAGSHRQFVRVSRALAKAGYAVLRMDYRGMGDSNGEKRDFLAVDDDIKAGIDLMFEHVASVQRVALWGLCDAASAALLYLHGTRDRRVQGLCLLNPWVRSDASLARTQVKHYYRDRLRQREFWMKLASGRVAWGALVGLARNVRAAFGTEPNSGAAIQDSYQDRMAAAWMAFDQPMLLLLSGDDYTAKEFQELTSSSPAWTKAMEKSGLIRHIESEADHTLSNGRFHSVLEDWSLELLEKLAYGGARGIAS
jgi:exosortase A-associated hydrolase 1